MDPLVIDPRLAELLESEDEDEEVEVDEEVVEVDREEEAEADDTLWVPLEELGIERETLLLKFDVEGKLLFGPADDEDDEASVVGVVDELLPEIRPPLTFILLFLSLSNLSSFIFDSFL